MQELLKATPTFEKIASTFEKATPTYELLCLLMHAIGMA